MNLKQVSAIVSVFILVFNLASCTFCSAKANNIDLGKISVGGNREKCFSSIIESVDFDKKQDCTLKVMTLSTINDFSLLIKNDIGNVLTEQKGKNGAALLEYTISNSTSLPLNYQVCIKNNNYYVSKLEASGALVANCKVKEPTPLWLKFIYGWLIFAGVVNFLAQIIR